MKKLVHNRTEDRLTGRDPKIEFTKASSEEAEELLFSKLVEEGMEWMFAKERDRRLMELGDVLCVIFGMGQVDGIEPMEIMAQAFNKQTDVGDLSDLVTMTITLDHERSKSIEMRVEPAAATRVSYTNSCYSG